MGREGKRDLSELPELSEEEFPRYARHLTIPEFGVEGQRKLKAARVLCVGTGGLGSPIAMYLAAAGIGKLGLVDFDTVDLSNLQRQLLHGTKDIGRTKLDSATETLNDLNPHVEIEHFPVRFTAENAREIASGYDLIVDGTDNFATRYLSNDVAVLLGIPNVYGSIFRFEGQVSVFDPRQNGPCYRCLFPQPPEPGLVPSCAEGGVLGVLPGVVGSLQATEAIKLITGLGDPLIGRLLTFDALRMRFRDFKLRRDPECALCGESPTITDLIDYNAFCGTPDPMDTTNEITVHDLKSRMDQRAEKPFTLLDVREPHEFEFCALGDATLIPLGELGNRLDELDKEGEIIIHCKAGGRSAQALALLEANDFKDAKHVAGGINAWSQEIDSSVPYY